jgi:hypothetical protein
MINQFSTWKLRKQIPVPIPTYELIMAYRNEIAKTMPAGTQIPMHAAILHAVQTAQACAKSAAKVVALGALVVCAEARADFLFAIDPGLYVWNGGMATSVGGSWVGVGWDRFPGVSPPWNPTGQSNFVIDLPQQAPPPAPPPPPPVVIVIPPQAPPARQTPLAPPVVW